MQIIKPQKLSLINKSYGLKGNQFSVGALSFFRLGSTNKLLTENTQWPLISHFLNQGIYLDLGFEKSNGEFLVAGEAFALNSKPVKKMEVSVKLGKKKKSLLASTKNSTVPAPS